MRFSMALAAALALAATGARAQYGSVTKPLSLGVRAGVFMPKDTDNGKSWLAVGVDGKINLPFLPIIGGQEVSVDYIRKNSDASLMGVTLVQKFSSPTVVPGQPKTYVGVGVGAYKYQWKTETADEDKTVAGFKGLLGVNYKNYYLQGDYHYPLGSDAKPVRGFAITLGVRY